MTDGQKIQDALDETLKIPFWKAAYDDAPTDLSRRFMALKIYVNIFAPEDEEPEYLEEFYSLFAVMSQEDWKYVYRQCRHIFDYDLKGEAIYRIMLMESRDLSCEEWVRLFSALDGEGDPLWKGMWTGKVKIYEQFHSHPADGQART
ncbi:MAG: hypothetical protein LUD51_06125 [Clostridia bacterium]|nr:hypothetical protein [Clostridia bacterium]